MQKGAYPGARTPACRFCLVTRTAGHGKVISPPWPLELTSRLVCGPGSTAELQLALDLASLLVLGLDKAV